MKMRATLRNVFYGRAPRPLREAYLRLRLRAEARRLVSLRAPSEDPAEWIDALLASHAFRPLQKRSEVLRLLEVVRALRPSAVCEVGAAGGGTAFLFAHAAAPDALVVSLDLAFGAGRREALREFARDAQRVVAVEGDSHSDATLELVRGQLAGRPLDLLYLDGDHSYEGVSEDFRMYGPLVRAGGLVVFHDIVPDYRTRYGVETASQTGGVPRFWAELKAAGASVEEIVEDAGQDGFGLGILKAVKSEE
jgi:predicted O-methyltransferase YrrM